MTIAIVGAGEEDAALKRRRLVARHGFGDIRRHPTPSPTVAPNCFCRRTTVVGE